MPALIPRIAKRHYLRMSTYSMFYNTGDTVILHLKLAMKNVKKCEVESIYCLSSNQFNVIESPSE